MAVLTHTQNRPATTPAHYDTRLDQLLEAADEAPNDDAFLAAMTRIAGLVGQPLPASGYLAHCACSCYGAARCETWFDATAPGTRVIENADAGYNLARIQCPWCADQHPETA
ncbi:hypothetical protein [Streptomyces sp. NPDC008150]|uniref:hypothetical protein n=1 Tax=Streptomyces sp. NPDC008150 TaxID=3364816 RepID=UPI0036E04BC7